MKCEQCNEKMRTSVKKLMKHMRPICSKCRKYNIHQFVNGVPSAQIRNIYDALVAFQEGLK